jgi:hypothetical protein
MAELGKVGREDRTAVGETVQVAQCISMRPVPLVNATAEPVLVIYCACDACSMYVQTVITGMQISHANAVFTQTG